MTITTYLIIIPMIGFMIFSNSNAYSRPCRSMEWECDNGECIKIDDRCDGKQHCYDGSDETAEYCIHFHCPLFAFRCSYGGCITGSHKCNGQRDCVDNSDESAFLCSNKYYEMESKLSGNCSWTDFQCKSGECLSSEIRCDGEIDCADGSDETVEYCSHLFCPTYAFQCGYGGCIRGNAKCDGNIDCADGSDEAAELCGYARDKTKITSMKKPMPTKNPLPQSCLLPFNRIHLLVTNDTSEHQFRLGERISSGTFVKFSCDVKWMLVGSDNNACVDGKWLREVPYCNKSCSRNALHRGLSSTAKCYVNGIARSCLNATLTIGAKAEISCASGYQLENLPQLIQSTTLTCGADAEWDFPKPKCTPQCSSVSEDTRHAHGVEMQWDVSIYQRTLEPIFQRKCSGAILSHKVVITGAICIASSDFMADNDYLLYNIVEGNYHATSYRQADVYDAVVHNVSEIVWQNTQLQNNRNIALLVIVDVFEFKFNLKPICMQFSDDVFHADASIIAHTQIGNFFNKTWSRAEIRTHLGTVIGLKKRKQQKVTVGLVSEQLGSGKLKLLNLNEFKTLISQYVKRYDYLL